MNINETQTFFLLLLNFELFYVSRTSSFEAIATREDLIKNVLDIWHSLLTRSAKQRLRFSLPRIIERIANLLVFSGLKTPRRRLCGGEVLRDFYSRESGSHVALFVRAFLVSHLIEKLLLRCVGKLFKWSVSLRLSPSLTSASYLSMC